MSIQSVAEIFLLIIYSRETDRQTGKLTNIPTFWFTPQMFTMAKTGPGPRGSTQDLHGLTGPNDLNPDWLPPGVYISRKLEPGDGMCVKDLCSSLCPHTAEEVDALPSTCFLSLAGSLTFSWWLASVFWSAAAGYSLCSLAELLQHEFWVTSANPSLVLTALVLKLQKCIIFKNVI